MPVAREAERGGRGDAAKYSVGDIVVWRLEQESEKFGKQKVDLDGVKMRTKKDESTALLNEQRRAERAGELVVASDVARAWKDTIRRARSVLLALPDEFEIRAHQLKTPSSAADWLRDAIRGALTELAAK